MKYVVCAVRDSAAEVYSQPWFLPSKGVGIRVFTDQLRNPETPQFKHPNDYTLFALGTFDDETGQFENLPRPDQLIRGSDVKE